MTEAEWLACNEPEAMLSFCQHNARSARKSRLFAVACCRLIWDTLNERDQHAVDVSERYADGQASEEEFRAIMFFSLRGYLDPKGWVVAAARSAGGWLHERSLIEHFANLNSPTSIAAGLDVAVGLIRDIFGNPFRPLTFSPSWRTDTALSLTRQMYESRDFSAMPILADALQDAGCDSDDVLSHCRALEQAHVRGCWVADLVLGKG
jgi:hypothetical protein